jgi:hypothetical protein
MPTTKKPVCFAFKKKGRCGKGDACLFAHIETEKTRAAQQPKVCRDMLSGKCKYSDKCKFLHDKRSIMQASKEMAEAKEKGGAVVATQMDEAAAKQGHAGKVKKRKRAAESVDQGQAADETRENMLERKTSAENQAGRHKKKKNKRTRKTAAQRRRNAAENKKQLDAEADAYLKSLQA